MHYRQKIEQKRELFQNKKKTRKIKIYLKISEFVKIGIRFLLCWMILADVRLKFTLRGSGDNTVLC